MEKNQDKDPETRRKVVLPPWDDLVDINSNSKSVNSSNHTYTEEPTNPDMLLVTNQAFLPNVIDPKIEEIDKKLSEISIKQVPQESEQRQGQKSVLDNLQQEDGDMEAAKKYIAFAKTMLTEQNFGTAIQMYKKDLSIKVRILGKKNQEVSNDLFNLGFAFHQNEKYHEALDCYWERNKLQMEMKVDDEIEIADTYQNIAVSYEKLKEYDKSISANEECLRVLMANPQKNGYKILKSQIRTATAYNYKGTANNSKSDFDKAARLFEDIASVQYQTMGKDNPELASSYQNLAYAYYHLESYDAAIECYKRSIQVRILTKGKTDPNIKTCHTWLEKCLKAKENKKMMQFLFFQFCSSIQK